MIAPDDTQLITEGSELRRKFLDGMIAQIDSVYLQHISSYAKLLVQRNAYLKSCKGGIPVDLTLLKLYNEQLNHHAAPIVVKRNVFVQKLIEEATTIYQVIANDIEEIKIEYDSKLLQQPLLNLLEINLFKDVITARTNYGIHKDDLVFTMNGMPLKQVASQGQRKSFLFALKLAQYHLINNHQAQKPILLLDDIFEKLDESRSEKLIQYVKGLNTQIFITDTQKHRVQKEFKEFEQDLQFIEIL
jgi:DNA replication and repair protein RecF